MTTARVQQRRRTRARREVQRLGQQVEEAMAELNDAYERAKGD